MPVPSTAADLSTTAASNSPAGADAIGTSLDDYLRSIQAIIKQQDSKGSDIASATTIDVPSSGKYFVVTGTTTITGISDDWNGRVVVLKFSGALQLTHSASLILMTSANITTAAGDCSMFVNESTGVWRMVAYQRADGASIFASIYRSSSGGSADAMTCSTTPVIHSYTAGIRLKITPPGANTITSPTVNANGLGAKTIKKRDSSGAKVALSVGDYNASGPFDLDYDGTDFILLNPDLTNGFLAKTSNVGIGYGVGAGGSVTQATSKSTTVTLNKICGQITMNNAALAANTSVSFTVNNSLSSNKDTISASIVSGFASFGSYTIDVVPGTGSFVAILRNITSGSLSEGVIFNFAIIKGSDS